MSTPTTEPAPTTVWDEQHLARAAFSHVIAGSDPFLRMRLDVDDPAEVWADACLTDETYAPRIKALGIQTGRIPDKADANGWRFIIPGDDEWPASLDHLGTKTPIGLWACGPVRLDAASRGRDAIAFAGPRAVEDVDRALAAQIGQALATNAKTLIAGLSLGAQVHALEAALDNGGRVVAVSPGRVIFHAAAALSERVMTSGVLVSHRPFDMTATREDHQQTMRIVAALADALVYCNAPTRSTAEVAFQTAVDTHRRLFMQPGHPKAEALGNLEVAETFTGAADLLQVLDAEA